MKKFFSEDNIIFSALSYLGDLILLNALFLLCCLPVITVGSSMTAAFRVASKLVDRSCGHISKEFLSALRSNFRQSTPPWLLALFIYALLPLYYAMSAGGENALMGYWLAGSFVIALFVSAVLCYLFPLISRYENDLLTHIKNAALLAVLNLPRTLVMMAMSLFPAALLILYPGLFFYLIPVWLLFGFSVIINMNAAVLRPVLKKLDEGADGEGE